MRNATCVGTQTLKVPTRVTLLFIPYTEVLEKACISVFAIFSFFAKKIFITKICLGNLNSVINLSLFRLFRCFLYEIQTSESTISIPARWMHSYESDQAGSLQSGLARFYMNVIVKIYEKYT